MLRRVVASAAVAFVLAAGCASADAPEEEVGTTAEALTAYCKANVRGIGQLDTETEYLPGVVHCENGGAPFEALKAQAIAARTYLYYKMETAGSIANGQSDQVYSCGSPPTALQKKAVLDTAGMVLRYKSTTIAAFYVAGGAASAPSCKGGYASTEQYVTYNQGLSGSALHQTTLGWVSPTNNRNRGCMSQLGSRCLANAGKSVEQILRFYYGADIGIEKASGSCVPSTPPPPPPPPPTTPPPKADAGAPKADAGAPPAEDPEEGEVDPGAGPPDEPNGAAPDDDAPGGGQLGRRGVRRFDDEATGCSAAPLPGAGRTAPPLVGLAFALSLALASARRRRRRARASAGLPVDPR